MKTAIAFFAAFTFWASASASAESLCNCCGVGTASLCATACASVKPAPGQCIATLDPSGNSVIGPDQNPLYDTPLRNVWLDSSDRKSLETFRRLLESARKSAEADRKSALRALKTGKLGDTSGRSLAARYDDALVNYYLGIQAYRMALTDANSQMQLSR